MTGATAHLCQLRQLALLHGIQHSFRDVAGQLREASEESLVGAIRAFGIPLERPQEVSALLREQQSRLGSQVMEPVAVAWAGEAVIALRIPVHGLAARYDGCLTLETGQCRTYAGRLAELRTKRILKLAGATYVVKLLRLPGRLPPGYHRFRLETRGQSTEATLIAAPKTVYQGEPGDQGTFWGVFLPLYALYRRSSWGAGNFSDLAALMQWAAAQGANLVATLPLLACDCWAESPSPYAPASRLFWSEFYLDVTAIPELASCAEARELLDSREYRGALESLRASPRVDYRRQSALQRRVLEHLARSFFATQSARRGALEEYCRANPQLDDYARFRAAAERHGPEWDRWPEPLRSGRIRPGDYDEAIYRYHVYVQWQTETQLRAAAIRAREANLLWYLDFPLGVSRNGYDVWRQRDLFALGASGGAPPDAFFTKGQNWGFPPLHPERLRQQRYQYLIDALRGHLRLARLLRLDHVMGLHRLYWVPSGLDAAQGVYVHYRMDELLAILSLESHRHQARLVGENLGTVPPEVDAAMNRHGINGMYVLQYELGADAKGPVRPIPRAVVASLNTHDMPTFSAFLRAWDVEDRLELGLLSNQEAQEARDHRAKQCRALAEFFSRQGLLRAPWNDPNAIARLQQSLMQSGGSAMEDVAERSSRNMAQEYPEALTEAGLAYLSQSPALLVLVNLEDLWGETRPQNTPGTSTERVNWQRKAQYSFEQFCQLPGVLRIMRRVAEGRRLLGRSWQGR